MKNKILHQQTIKPLLATIFLMSVVLTLHAQDWVNVKTFQPGQTLHCIRFANDSTGYTVSSLYNGSTYNIHKTMDGGETWIDQSSGYTSTRFKDIFIFSEDTVMMCGNFGLVIKTTDGGDNWIADTVSPEGHHLFGISFVGETGYVCGNSGAIYKTTDMGETWEQVNPPFITAIEEIYFMTPDFGFICGLNFIYYTEDGGNTWVVPETFPGATTNWWLRQFAFPNDSVGYVCADIGQVYKTEDRGKNWEYMENSPTTESLQAIVALNENTLYACGYAGTVMRSFDGAKNWEIMTAASQQNFYSMDFTPEGVGFISTHIGEVLRYTDPYLSIGEKPENTTLTLYPNPATDFINIESNKDIIDVEIFGAQGIKLTGQSSRQVDLRGLNPGIYFAVITTSTGKFIKKISVQ